MNLRPVCRILPLLLFYFLVVQGCHSRNAGNMLASLNNESEFAGPDTIQVIYNQAIQIGESAYYIRFDTLFRDSRCPEDVHCIWKGAWEIGMELQGRDITYRMKLGTYHQNKPDTTLAGFTIQILDLLPRPNTTVKHAKSDYRAVVVIKKAPPNPV